MTPRSRSILIWLAWTILVGFALLFYVRETRGATRASRRVNKTTQGAGATALVSSVKAPEVPPVPMPKAMAIPTRPPAVWFFAATASDTNGLESDFSTELIYTNSLRTNLVALAWDAVTNSKCTYRVYYGRASRTYTNAINAGTKMRVQFPLVTVLTNIAITVSWPTKSLTLTNPVASSCFWTGKNLTISARRF